MKKFKSNLYFWLINTIDIYDLVSYDKQCDSIQKKKCRTWESVEI